MCFKFDDKNIMYFKYSLIIYYNVYCEYMSITFSEINL